MLFSSQTKRANLHSVEHPFHYKIAKALKSLCQNSKQPHLFHQKGALGVPKLKASKKIQAQISHMSVRIRGKFKIANNLSHSQRNVEQSSYTGNYR